MSGLERATSLYQNKKLQEGAQKELNEMEASKLLDTEFKTMVVRMLEELSENFDKEKTSIKKYIETIKRSCQK